VLCVRRGPVLRADREYNTMSEDERVVWHGAVLRRGALAELDVAMDAAGAAPAALR
jgi:hypothetical protein